MLYEDFYSQFIDSYNEGDNDAASLALMRELGNILVKKREDFVYLLNESEIPATTEMSDAELIDLFVENVGKSPQLTLGASLLANIENAQTSFDGEKQVSDDAVKAGYSCMMCYFNGDNYSNVAADPVTAIAQGVGELSKLGTTVASGAQKRKFGLSDTAAQRQQARSEIIKQVIAQRTAQVEAAQKKKETQEKTTRTLLIVGGIVIGLTALGVAIYMMRKKAGK